MPKLTNEALQKMLRVRLLLSENLHFLACFIYSLEDQYFLKQNVDLSDFNSGPVLCEPSVTNGLVGCQNLREAACMDNTFHQAFSLGSPKFKMMQQMDIQTFEFSLAWHQVNLTSSTGTWKSCLNHPPLVKCFC
jgi:hypothetical protein